MRKVCKTAHTIGLDTRCHIDFGLVHLKRRVGIYGSVMVDMIVNQADKPQILEVIESCSDTKNSSELLVQCS